MTEPPSRTTACACAHFSGRVLWKPLDTESCADVGVKGIPTTFPFQLSSPESEIGSAEPASSFWVRTQRNPSREPPPPDAARFCFAVMAHNDRKEKRKPVNLDGCALGFPRLGVQTLIHRDPIETNCIDASHRKGQIRP